MKKIKYTFLICLYSFYIAPVVAAQSAPFLEIYGWKYEEKGLRKKELKLMKELFLINAQKRKDHSNHPYNCMPMYKDDYTRIAQKIVPGKNIEKHTVAEAEKIIAA